MSKVQGKPFIQQVVDTLTSEQKAELLNLINGSEATPAFRSMTNSTYFITGADKNKVQYVILETWNKTYNGYLIYNNSYCVLISFSNNTQILAMLDLNLTRGSYRLVRQYLDILELRFILSGGSGSTSEAPAIFETSNITALSNDQLNSLKAGDVVNKLTGNQVHSYRVSYKEHEQGICLTYTDASMAETVSYDYTGGTWVYNSTDVMEFVSSSDVTAAINTAIYGAIDANY